MARIAVERLGKHFVLDGAQLANSTSGDELVVLDGMDLRIEPGEFVALVGPSGSGKSVLLDILGGLSRPTSGRVLLDGQPIVKPDDRIGYVFQQYALFPWRTARENIEYPLEIKGVAPDVRRESVERHLAMLGLSNFAEWYPNQLSGGMQQRIALARALVARPEVLLMDEPFAALDAQTREILQEELLRSWADTRCSVVFVTHSIEEAVFLADRILVVTARPASIKREIRVDLPRPRLGDIRSGSEFNRVRHEVWSHLKDEVDRSRGERELAALKG